MTRMGQADVTEHPAGADGRVSGSSAKTAKRAGIGTDDGDEWGSDDDFGPEPEDWGSLGAAGSGFGSHMSERVEDEPFNEDETASMTSEVHRGRGQHDGFDSDVEAMIGTDDNFGASPLDHVPASGDAVRRAAVIPRTEEIEPEDDTFEDESFHSFDPDDEIGAGDMFDFSEPPEDVDMGGFGEDFDDDPDMPKVEASVPVVAVNRGARKHDVPRVLQSSLEQTPLQKRKMALAIRKQAFTMRRVQKRVKLERASVAQDEETSEKKEFVANQVTKVKEIVQFQERKRAAAALGHRVPLQALRKPKIGMLVHEASDGAGQGAVAGRSAFDAATVPLVVPLGEMSDELQSMQDVGRIRYVERATDGAWSSTAAALDERLRMLALFEDSDGTSPVDHGIVEEAMELKEQMKISRKKRKAEKKARRKAGAAGKQGGESEGHDTTQVDTSALWSATLAPLHLVDCLTPFPAKKDMFVWFMHWKRYSYLSLGLVPENLYMTGKARHLSPEQRTQLRKLFLEPLPARRFPLCRFDPQYQRDRGRVVRGEWTYVPPPSRQKTCISMIARPRSPLLLVSGPAGYGKTTLVRACAAGAGFMPYEINASDDRAGSTLFKLIRQLMVQPIQLQTEGGARAVSAGSEGDDVLPKPTCIILDEMDGMDPGAVKKLVTFLEKCAAREDTSLEALNDSIESCRERCIDALETVFEAEYPSTEQARRHELAPLPASEVESARQLASRAIVEALGALGAYLEKKNAINTELDKGREASRSKRGRGEGKSKKKKGKKGKTRSDGGETESKRAKQACLWRVPIICICNDTSSPSVVALSRAKFVVTPRVYRRTAPRRVSEVRPGAAGDTRPEQRPSMREDIVRPFNVAGKYIMVGPDRRRVERVLRKQLRAAGVFIDKGCVGKILTHFGDDLRATINHLQFLCASSSRKAGQLHLTLDGVMETLERSRKDMGSILMNPGLPTRLLRRMWDLVLKQPSVEDPLPLSFVTQLTKQGKPTNQRGLGIRLACRADDTALQQRASPLHYWVNVDKHFIYTASVARH